MKYIAGVGTNIGTVRESNQDAVCIMEAETVKGTVHMILVCDGMGGLSKGEVASATVIRSFERWFQEELPDLIEQFDRELIKKIWIKKLTYLSDRLKDYGMKNKLLLGTTFSGMLFIEKQYIWVHVGDSRIYKINELRATQLTTDHTVIARELALGNITEEEAKHSKLRNKLTQCVGASKVFEPETGDGIVKRGETFLLCSDGFYHKFLKDEMLELSKKEFQDEHSLDEFCKTAIEKVLRRGEKDNASVAIVKCD